jgi:hypothetical protein
MDTYLGPLEAESLQVLILGTAYFEGVICSKKSYIYIILYYFSQYTWWVLSGYPLGIMKKIEKRSQDVSKNRMLALRGRFNFWNAPQIFSLNYYLQIC